LPVYINSTALRKFSYTAALTPKTLSSSIRWRIGVQAIPAPEAVGSTVTLIIFMRYCAKTPAYLGNKPLSSEYNV